MNVLRVRLVTASVLQQEVTSRADEEIRPDEQHVKIHNMYQAWNPMRYHHSQSAWDTIRSTRYVARESWIVLGWIHRRDLYWWGRDWWLNKLDVRASEKMCARARRHLKRWVLCCLVHLEVMGVVLDCRMCVSVVFFHGEMRQNCWYVSWRACETTRLPGNVWKLYMEHRLWVYIGKDWINVCCNTLLSTDWMWCLVRCYWNEWHDTWLVIEWLGSITNVETTHHSLTAARSQLDWLEERSVLRKVRAVSSGESEFHGLGTGAVTRLLMRYTCREDREQTKIPVAYCDSVASHMEQQLGATSKWNGFGCNKEWTRLNCGTMLCGYCWTWGEWIWLLEWSVLCSSQKRKSRGRWFLTVMWSMKSETVNVASKVWKRLMVGDMKATDLRLSKGVAAHEFMFIHPMKWWRPGPSKQREIQLWEKGMCAHSKWTVRVTSEEFSKGNQQRDQLRDESHNTVNVMNKADLNIWECVHLERVTDIL